MTLKYINRIIIASFLFGLVSLSLKAYAETSALSTFDYLKKQDDQTKTKLKVAKAIKKNLKTVEEKAFIFNESSKNTLLFIAEFLCHNCHHVFENVKEIDYKKEKFNFWVLSLPLFKGDLSPQYGLIMKAAYEADPSKFIEVLAKYQTGDKDALLKLIKSDLEIKINDNVIEDLKKYDDHAKLASDLGVEFIPMLFFITVDESNNHIVVPLRNIPPKDLIVLINNIKELKKNDLSELKKILDQ